VRCITNGHKPQLHQIANNPSAILRYTAHQPGIIFANVPKNPTLEIAFTVKLIQSVKNNQMAGTNQLRTILTTRIEWLKFILNKNGKANNSQTIKKLPNICAVGMPPGSQKLSNNRKKSSKVNNWHKTNTTNISTYAYITFLVSVVLASRDGVVFVKILMLKLYVLKRLITTVVIFIIVLVFFRVLS